MINNNRDLLLQCMYERLPYGLMGVVTIEVWSSEINDNVDMNVLVLLIDINFKTQEIELECLEDNEELCHYFNDLQWMQTFTVDEFKPYLVTYDGIDSLLEGDDSKTHEVLNWCYKNGIDVSKLVEKNIALEAPKGLYNVVDYNLPPRLM